MLKTGRTKLMVLLTLLAVLISALVAMPTFASRLSGDGPDNPIGHIIGRPVADKGGNSSSNPTPVPVSEDPTMDKELAPIEGIEIRVAESFPPQNTVHVEFGLRNGCAKPGGYEVKRDGNEISVQVFALVPADTDVICTMIYGISSYDIALGTDLTAGQTYTLNVNGETKSFTAQ